MKSHILETSSLGDLSHSAVNLNNQLVSIQEKWGLTDKVVAITTDNAAAQLRAIELNNSKSIRCCAHTIQLAIKNAMNNNPKVIELIDLCQNIVRRFKKSNTAASILRDCQKKLGVSELNVLQNVIEFF